jgi:hypothetical protein
MLNALRRLIQRYGFFKREPEAPAPTPNWYLDGWYSADSYAKLQNTPMTYSEAMAAGMVNAHPAAVKSARLAQIARERDALKEQLAKAIRDKKARQPIYKALRALSVEELNIEAGR